MSSTPYVITQPQARELLAQVDVPQILRKLFRDLAAGPVSYTHLTLPTILLV